MANQRQLSAPGAVRRCGPLRNPRDNQTPRRLFEIEGALFLEALQISEDILLDFLRLGFRIQFLQVGNNLLDRVISVAALDDFQARAVEPQRSFRHQEHSRRLRLFIEAAAWSEARALGQLWRHADSFAG